MAEYRIVKYRDTKGVLRTKRVKVASTASNKTEKEESKIAWQNNAGKTVKSQSKASSVSDAVKTYSQKNNNQYRNIYGQNNSSSKTAKVNLSTPALKKSGYNTLLENLEKSKEKKRNEGKIAWQESSNQYENLSYNDRVRIYLENNNPFETAKDIDDTKRWYESATEKTQQNDINAAGREITASGRFAALYEQNPDMVGAQDAKKEAEQHKKNADTINADINNRIKLEQRLQEKEAQREIDEKSYKASIADIERLADEESEKYIQIGANNNRFSNISEEQQNYIRENYDTDKSFKENVDASIYDVKNWGRNFEYVTNNEAILWSLMTDDQKDTYNYILGHDGERAASDYMDQIEPFLAQQYGDMADKAVDEYYKDQPLGEAQAVIAKGTTSFATGVQSHVKGLINAGAQIMGEEGFGDNFLDWSYQGFSRNAEGIEKTLYDLGYQSGNMLPSILTGNIAGGVAGSVLMGISASGNAYNQALSEGYSVNDAKLYGVVIGISETVMERALGGISGLAVKGGLADTIANKAVAGIKNIIKNPKANYVTSKIVGYLAGNSGEFVEEYLQECFEPIYRNILFNEDNEVNFFTQEAFEAGFMGYLMAGVNNAVVMSGNNIRVLNEAGEMRNIEGGLEGLIESGIESPRGTLSSKMAHYLQQKILSGEKVSNFEVSMLIEGNKQVIADEEIISEYINGIQQFKNISREGQTALLNPENIEVNNNRYGINIPENATPKQIAEYLKGLNAENKANYLKENEVRYTDAQLNKSVSKYYENVENVTGKKIYVKSMAENIEGYIDGDRIVLNSNMAGTVQQANWVLAHELTHSAENTKTYAELENMALESIEDIDAAVKAKQELYEKNGHPITRETALQELVAEYAQKTIFADTDGITEIIRRNGNVAQRIYQFIVDKINYFKSLTNMTTAERKQYSELKSVQRIWEKALLEGKTVQRNERIKYSIAKNFSEQVDDVLNGKHPVNDHVYMGETPKVLQEIGFAALPMLTTQKHIKTITNDSGNMKANYHGLGAEMVKQLPKAIEDPIMIVKSKTHPDTSVVVVTELLDKQNRPVIASVLFDGKGMMNSVEVDSNIMTSAYGRNNFKDFFRDMFNSEDNFYYTDIKKSLAFANTLGLQLPNAINKTGFYNSIRKNDENINNFDKKDTRKFSISDNTEDVTAKIKSIFSGKNGSKAAEHFNRVVNHAIREINEFMPQIRTGVRENLKSYAAAVLESDMAAYKEIAVLEKRYRGKAREAAAVIERINKGYILSDGDKATALDISNGKNVNLDEYGDKAEALQEYAQALKDERYIDEESERILKRAFDKQKKLSKNIFNDLYENAVAEDTMDLEVKKDILDRLKHKMYVSRSVKAELGDDYRPRMHGFNLTGDAKANISANAIDSNYYDLSKAYPQYFPQDIINPADQLKRMFEIKDNITTPNLMREVYGEEYRVAAMQEFTDFYNKIKRAGARAATINEITIPQNLKESQYYEAPSVSFLENKLNYDAMTIEDMRNKKKAATSVLRQLDNMYGFTASEKSIAIKIADNRMSADNIPGGMDRQAILSYAEAYRTRLATQMAEERRKILTDKALKRLKDLKRLSREKGLSDADKSDILDILGKYDYVSKSMTTKGEFDTRRIADEYRAILEEHPNAAITKSVEDKLSRLDKIRLNEMSADDIYTLIQDISALEYTVRHMNSVLGSERQDGISEAANEAVKAVENSAGFKETTRAFVKYIRNKTKIDWIRPQTFFEQITGYEAIGRELYEMLSEGTIKKAKFKNEALSLFSEFNTQNKEFIKHISGKDARWIKIDVGGKQYEITPAMRISLYLHSKNDGNLRHFSEAVSEVKGEDGKIHLEMRMGQGITIPNKKYYEKGMKSEAYIHGATVQITRDELKTILDNMTETEKAFGDIAYKYFNETSKKAINETSNLLEGISVAEVENYFPLQSDPNKLRQGMDVKAQAEALANIDVTSKGFLKERQNARNAIILDDVTSILLNQIEAVSDYYGYAVAHRNFEAILSDPVIRDNENGYSDTLEEVITKQYGREAMDYVKKMLEDNIGINKPDRSFWGALQGRFASAVLGANPSVVIKQLSAYPAAGAVIGQQSLVKGLFRDTTFTPAQVRALDETIGRYTPMLGIRKEGTGVREIGDVLKNNPAWVQKAPVLMQLSGIVDTAVIRKLWGACESYVEDTLGMYKNEKPLDNVENREVADNKHRSTDMTFEEAIGSGEFIRKSGMERSKFKQFVLFLKRNLKNKTSHERFELFKASSEEIEAFAKAGFDISGKVHTVRANALYHMDKRRGGQSELIENRINRNINLISDYEAIPYVIKNAQSVYLNRNQKGENRGILYEYKDNNGMVYYVESIANGDYLDGIQFMKLGNDVSDNPYKNVVNSEPIYTRGADANIITANTTEAGNSVTTPGYYARNVPSDGNITQQKNKSNKKYVSEDEYYKAVAKVFNECIFATQQNYTPMQRSQILRRTDPLSKLLTLFSSQNNQNYNILYEAAGRYKAYKSKYGKNSEQFKQAKQQLGRAATSYILQNITFAGLGVFIKATIKGGYDDEEEGVQYFLSQLIGAFAGTVYFGNELYDLIMSGINGRDWEGINIAVFGMIQDLGNNISELVQAIANISNTGTTNNNVLQSIRAVSKLVAQMFGVPAENAESYIKDIVGRITEAASGGEFSFEKWYDGIFYKNGVSDIKEAKENEVKQIATDVLYSSMSTVYDKAGGKEIIRLTQIFKNDEDHNISDIYLMSPPTRRTYNSKDYILTGSEKDMWTAKQNGALKQLNDYVESDEYKALTDEQKFEAVSVYIENAQKTADRWLASEHDEKQDDIYMTINKNGSNISDYATYKALTYDANKVEDERYSEKDKKEILSEMDISEESMAGIYKSVFETKDTKQEDSIFSAMENGVSAKTYIEYEAKEFKGENKSLQKKNWILNHCETDKEIQEMYSRFVESAGTDYYNSIDYVVKQGVSAKKYVQFKMAVESAHGTKEDESTPYVYWRSGGLVTEEVYQNESGSVAAEIYDELLSGGYSDKEVEVLYSMQYSNDAKYPYIMQSGISAKEYVRYKKLLQDVEGGTGKKQRVLQMINTLNLSASKKRIIAMLCGGYALGTNDYYDVIQYINNLNLSASEKYKLAEKIGLAVENGRVYARKAS